MRLRPNIQTLFGLAHVACVLVAATMLPPAASTAAAREFTYQNPLQGGPDWIRDPFIIRTADKYFMTGTYKEPDRDGLPAWPGFKLWSSDDLRHWKDEGFVLRNEDIKWGDTKLWAPEIRPFDEVGHGSLFTGPDGRWWLSSHGYGYQPGPFRRPRLCIDPLNFDPATGEFAAKLTWTPQTIPIATAMRPRLIILADMGNEPDEEQQMVHMLVNCNEFELEGLIAVTGKFLNERSANEYKRTVHPELFHNLIDGYEKVVPNLRLHAPAYPAADALRALVASGQPRYGMADVGEGKSSPGSELIVKALKRDDPRPLNIVVNAGSNTLAQALRDLRAVHSDVEMDALVARLRVFENGAQDNAGAWICREFPAVHWIRSNHQTYGYMGEGNGVGPYVWRPHPPGNQGQHRWAEQHIMQNHGPLGALYPYRFNGNGFLEGGGTIPWLGLVNKGLYDVDQPSWGGWSGRFTAAKQKNVWSRHSDIRKDEETYGDFYACAEAADRWKDPESGMEYDSEFAPVWRWRRAMLNNCQARFDWCVMPYEQANHHPVAAFNGDRGDTIVRLTASAGATITLDASASCDPDNDALRFRWYIYPEAGTYDGSPVIKDATNPVAKVTLPNDAASSQIHVILQVNDDHEIVSLYDYRRIVIDVEQPTTREGDWVVTGAETVRGRHIRLNGNLILERDAILTLEDCRLEIMGTRSREHLVDWRGGRLVTRRSTLGGVVLPDGTPVHTVFHLYDGRWDAVDTTVQYSYGISFHWQEGVGILQGTRLKAGPRPDAIICSGRADITLVDSDFPIGLGVYVHKGGRTRLDLPAGAPVTAVFDADTLTPGVEWRLDLKNTVVGHWFVFLRNIGMQNPPCEVTLGESRHLIVSLLGHNLTGELSLSNDLIEPVRLGNLTLRRAADPPGIAMWALYFSGDKTDLNVHGPTHICELMHRGGRLHLAGSPGKNDLTIGCTTLEASGAAAMTLEHVHLGSRSANAVDRVTGEVNVTENAVLTAKNISARGVRFHTRDSGRITITNLDQKGKTEVRQEGGPVQLQTAAESNP